MMNSEQLGEFKGILQERMNSLREEVRQELLKSDDEHFVDLAGQVYDLEESSVADLLVDLNLAMLDQHIDEIRDIDAAMIRIMKGEYGICIDCGCETEFSRLRVVPTAKRCQSCQTAYERMHAEFIHSSL